LISQKPSTQMSRGVANLITAIQENSTGHSDVALSYARIAKQQFQSINSSAGTSRATLEIVEALKRQQKGAQCYDISRKLLSDISGLSYTWIKGALLLKASSCYGMSGRPQVATRLAQQALDFVRKSGYADLWLLALFYNDGVGIAEPEIWSSAAWNSLSADLKTFWDVPYPADIGFGLYGDLSLLGANVKLWHFAELAGQEALAFASQMHDQQYLAVHHYWLGQMYEAAGEKAEADAEFSTAVQLFSDGSLSSQLSRTTAQIRRAGLQIKRGDLDAGSEILQEETKSLPKISNIFVSQLYYGWMGDLRLRQQRYAEAEHALVRAVSITDETLSQVRSTGERATWARVSDQFLRDLTELYFKYEDNPLKAYNSWNSRRAVSLIRTGKLEFVNSSSQRISSLHLGPLASRGPAAPDEVELSFAVLRSGVAGWFWNGKENESRWAPVAPDEIDRIVRHFLALCSDPRSDPGALIGDARQLYQILIRPFAERLKTAKYVVVDADGPLALLPFEALVDEKGTYLGDEISFVYRPGPKVSREIRHRKPLSADDELLVVADPSVDASSTTDFPPLPDSRREAYDVASIFKRHTILIGRDATLKNIVDRLSTAKIFHFAGHSLSTETTAALLVSNTDGSVQPFGLLDATDLFGKHLSKTKLVVLSACASAAPIAGDLASPTPLVRAFIDAGVADVVATRWSVDSRTTSDMMATFYSEIASGSSTALSVRVAAKKLRARSATSHPFFWAGYAAFKN
jgi:CHAT domain-containing protein/tetratricopeptide (TPR) repeat protein